MNNNNKKNKNYKKIDEQGNSMLQRVPIKKKTNNCSIENPIILPLFLRKQQRINYMQRTKNLPGSFFKEQSWRNASVVTKG